MFQLQTPNSKQLSEYGFYLPSGITLTNDEILTVCEHKKDRKQINTKTSSALNAKLKTVFYGYFSISESLFLHV